MQMWNIKHGLLYLLSTINPCEDLIPFSHLLCITSTVIAKNSLTFSTCYQKLEQNDHAMVSAHQLGD